MVGLVNYNPDVLTCLANLSSDGVFTPPSLANDMLDLLPDELWSDPTAKFLDPGCKSGVFLREIAKRLELGLEQHFPDLQTRLNHIFTKQIYGLAITELTALLARRSTYCSKVANGKYSVCEAFNDADGNIRFRPTPHTWLDGRCGYCGVSQQLYEQERSADLEAHAYEFIHTNEPQELFNMRFDVIVGNPPYQLSDGGFGKSASPIYHKFVEQAKKLEPRFLTMIIPSRWFAGGKGLNQFRKEMLADDQMRILVDHEDAKEVFPGVDIAGGVCYFLWEKGSQGPCEVINVHNGSGISSNRPLNEFDTFVRHSKAVSIIRKVIDAGDSTLADQVSSAKPFGLRTYARPMDDGDLVLRWHGGSGPYQRDNITIGRELIDRWKTTTSKVSYDHAGVPDKAGMRRVFSRIEILPPATICTETYLVVGAYDDRQSAEQMAQFLKTRFVRFLVAQLSFSQDIFKEKFRFVPNLPMDREWTDQDLYERYGLTLDEIDFIESKIRLME